MKLQTAPALRVGLTGGIGSGKSTVGGLLAQAGATVLDADAIEKLRSDARMPPASSNQ